VLLAYLRLAELAACVSYPAIFILPIKISLGITLLAAARTNFLHPRTLPLCCIAQGLGSLDSFLLFSMHWVVLKKEIMLNVEDISLTWAKEKHMNSYVQVFWQGWQDLNPQLLVAPNRTCTFQRIRLSRSFALRARLPVSLPRVSGITPII